MKTTSEIHDMIEKLDMRGNPKLAKQVLDILTAMEDRIRAAVVEAPEQKPIDAEIMRCVNLMVGLTNTSSQLLAMVDRHTEVQSALKCLARVPRATLERLIDPNCG